MLAYFRTPRLALRDESGRAWSPGGPLVSPPFERRSTGEDEKEVGDGRLERGPSPSAPEPSGQIIRILQNVLGERYPALSKHVNNVARLCSGTASEVGLPA